MCACVSTFEQVQSISSHYPIEVRLGAVHMLSNKPNQYGELPSISECGASSIVWERGFATGMGLFAA